MKNKKCKNPKSNVNVEAGQEIAPNVKGADKCSNTGGSCKIPDKK